MAKKFSFFILFFFFFTFFSYLLSSSGKTPYDYFTRLSSAFLDGRYWLKENPPWLSELIPAKQGFFVPYPPMPAILLMPLIFLFGQDFPQQYLAHLLGAGMVVMTIFISFKIKKDWQFCLWSGILVGFSSIVWFLSSVGSAWYLGQITAAFFLTAAILEALGGKRPFILGSLLGGAYLARIHTILSLPFFFYILLQKKEGIKLFFFFLLGILPFLIFNAFYNFIRFGVVWDKGYLLIPGVLEEPWFRHGIISPLYIKENLKVAFLSFPKILNDFPYIRPSWAGLAIWITTPSFIFSFLANLKDNLVKFSWLAVLLIFLFVLMHGSSGFAQFGYRFAVDFYPFLFFLTIKGVSQNRIFWYHWLLLLTGVFVNLWGVLWINKFGWVGF